MRNLPLSLVFLALLGGCGSPPPDYSYKGVLVRPDGSPAAGVPVIVAPASTIFRGIPQDAAQTTTDSAGRFSGGFGNDMDGHDWARLPLPAMPPLSGVYVWVRQESGWQPIAVSLDTLTQQQQSCMGQQKITLPPVIVATANAPPATRPSPTQP
jgi:hypothetical protein